VAAVYDRRNNWIQPKQRRSQRDYSPNGIAELPVQLTARETVPAMARP